MEKIYTPFLNKAEREENKNTYRIFVGEYIQDKVRCDGVLNLDASVMKNASNLFNDDGTMREINQVYAVNIPSFFRQNLIDWGFMISYSDLLDCDVLLVDFKENEMKFGEDE